MNRTTIDFGIDLGTTNSAIAVLKGVKPEVVKSNLDTDITPSAVFIGRQGKIMVGSRALDKLLDDRSCEDAYIEFKRRMGGDSVYTFKSSGLNKSPEELSAEVLKSLKGNVQLRMDEDIKAAVITIPAAFAQRQCVCRIARVWIPVRLREAFFLVGVRLRRWNIRRGRHEGGRRRHPGRQPRRG